MKTYLYLICCILPFNLFSQSANFDENSQFSVNSVYFFSPSFPATDGWIDIIRDDGQNYSYTNNRTTAYEYYGLNVRPVGYVSNNPIVAGADLDITLCNNNINIEDLIIKGIASNGFVFPPQKGVSIGSFLRYKKHRSNEVLENEKVQYFEEFKIKWYITNDQNALDPNLEEFVEWALVGESSNPLYVTFKSPESTLAQDYPGNPEQELLACGLGTIGNVPPPKWGYKWFHSLLKIGCSAASGGMTDEIIIDRIWKELETLSLEGADSGNLLSYYKDWNICFSQGAPVNTALLLKNDDGQCGSWAKFYIDLLRIQGVTHSSVNNDYMFFSASQTGPIPPDGFFVKNWEFTSSIYSNITPLYDKTLIPKQKIVNDVVISHELFNNNSEYTFNEVYSDGVNNADLKGQGLNSYPASIFSNHQITNIENELMDVSYGVQYSDLQDIENTAVEGYYIVRLVNLDETLYFDINGNNVDLNGNGDIEVNASVITYLVGTDKQNFSLTNFFLNH